VHPCVKGRFFLIYRVMREMHDGGAIYGGMRNSILRGNVVRDVV
jgi:hypothetical protein